MKYLGRYLILIIALSAILTTPAKSEFGIGSGVSSVMGGRPIPVIYLSVGGSSAALSAFATGYQSTLQYHSAYQANLFLKFKMTDFMWGDISSGVGWGIHFAERGLRTGPEVPKQIKNDFASGPSIRVLWKFLGPVFVGVESMFGLGGFANVVLTSQNVTVGLIGIQF